MKLLTDYRLGIGPMSKNVVDICIDFANDRDIALMLIPSRRQIEWNGGYSNGWTTETFARYVRERTGNILLVRDHGGPAQGSQSDDGMTSLRHDCAHFDLIHIDPWKAVKDFGAGCVRTKALIKYCHSINPNIQYEIGTEQAIFSYEAPYLDHLIRYLKDWLRTEVFAAIRFAVIQTGTSLEGNTNTGHFEAARLKDMIEVCHKQGLLSKMHNGDYLSNALVSTHFRAGLKAINIAPEFGQIETQTYLAEMTPNQVDTYYQVCYRSGKWKKWFPTTYAPTPTELINACGHYVVSTPPFRALKTQLKPEIDDRVKINLTKRLEELYGTTT